jgi:cytochrome P450
VDFDMQRVARNVGGLLIGAVETTSHATVNALEWLLRHKDLLAAAVRAAQRGPGEFDGYVFEALRFHPAFPYFARVCESPVTLAAGTDYAQAIQPGTIVLAITHSAMFDATAFLHPEEFDPNRSQSNAFHFGRGLHECLGRHIGRQMIPEIVRQVLLLPEIEAAGPVDYHGGPVPEAYPLRWNAESRPSSN